MVNAAICEAICWRSQGIVEYGVRLAHNRFGWVNEIGIARLDPGSADAGVNVLAIAHGSSDVSISLVVTVADTQRTIRALHRLTGPMGGG